jgi:hypothetical protein
MGGKLVGVVNVAGQFTFADTQTIRTVGFGIAAPFEYTSRVYAFKWLIASFIDEGNLGGIRLINADDPTRSLAVQAQQAEWVVKTGLQQRFNQRIHLNSHCSCLVEQL